MTTFVTPTLPWKYVSSDATAQSVTTQQGKNYADSVSTTTGIQYFHIAVDSANRIFMRIPISYTDFMPNYQWFTLDNTSTNYPVGAIDEINCSYTYNDLSCIIHIVVLANDIIYQFTALSAQPGTGLTTYGWQIITPVGPQPVYVNVI